MIIRIQNTIFVASEIAVVERQICNIYIRYKNTEQVGMLSFATADEAEDVLKFIQQSLIEFYAR